MIPSTAKRLFTAEEYQQMGEAGIFHEDDRVELLAGEIVTMTPIGKSHAGCVDFFTNFFGHILYQKACVRVQNPVRMGEYSEPQPDITLLKHREDYYRSRHPQPEDVYLIVEVVVSTGEYDRKIKTPLYAKHGVMELWIVDLEMRAVEVFRHPTDDGYVDSRVYRPGDALSPQAFPDVTLKVEDILG